MVDIFDSTVELPSNEVRDKASRLIGFDTLFDRVFGNLKLLLDHDSLLKWSNEHHKQELPFLASLKDKYPLVIFSGDAGTGKTIMAEAIADRALRELDKEGYFMKLSTRVRGEGLHGEMGNLVNNAFEELHKQAGKKRIAFLLIDEADAIATTRSTQQMHQEEKAAVNTLIQKIDELRNLNGRAILIMSTNRLHFLDEAIVRRAAVVLEFERPNEQERRELFIQSLEGIEIDDAKVEELVAKTGQQEGCDVGYSFSDITLRLIPESIARAYPDKPLSFDILNDVVGTIKPSPKIK